MERFNFADDFPQGYPKGYVDYINASRRSAENWKQHLLDNCGFTSVCMEWGPKPLEEWIKEGEPKFITDDV